MNEKKLHQFLEKQRTYMIYENYDTKNIVQPPPPNFKNLPKIWNTSTNKRTTSPCINKVENLYEFINILKSSNQGPHIFFFLHVNCQHASAELPVFATPYKANT